MQKTIPIHVDIYILYKPLARYVDDIFIREQERKELVSARKTSYFSSQKKKKKFLSLSLPKIIRFTPLSNVK